MARVPTPETCAREILEVIPPIVQAMRVHMRTHGLHDLSVPQFRTLAYIGRHPGCSLSAAAEFIGLTLPSMSVLVSGLVARELVTRATSPRDRRKVTLVLTATGVSIHQGALDGTLAWLTELLAPLADAERDSIFAALSALRPIFVGSSDGVAARD